jgi:hypothetical protein
MFAPGHAAVAWELARVCRPSGRLGLAHWRHERGVVGMFKVMALFQPPPPPGAGSPFQWGNPDYVEDLLGSSFKLRLMRHSTVSPAKGWWELFSTVYGPTRALAESLEPERRDELHRAFAGLFDGYRTDNGIHQPRPYLIVLGTRR